jgi:hypothetical protein
VCSSAEQSSTAWQMYLQFMYNCPAVQYLTACLHLSSHLLCFIFPPFISYFFSICVPLILSLYHPLSFPSFPHLIFLSLLPFLLSFTHFFCYPSSLASSHLVLSLSSTFTLRPFLHLLSSSLTSFILSPYLSPHLLPFPLLLLLPSYFPSLSPFYPSQARVSPL